MTNLIIITLKIMAYKKVSYFLIIYLLNYLEVKKFLHFKQEDIWFYMSIAHFFNK